MTPQQAARELLAAEQASALDQLAWLEREFAGIVDSSGQAGTDDEHDPDGATLAYERQRVAALLTQTREHLTQIRAALRRIDDGSYGTCEACGGLIASARLAARPATTVCLSCAARR